MGATSQAYAAAASALHGKGLHWPAQPWEAASAAAHVLRRQLCCSTQSALAPEVLLAAPTPYPCPPVAQQVRAMPSCQGLGPILRVHETADGAILPFLAASHLLCSTGRQPANKKAACQSEGRQGLPQPWQRVLAHSPGPNPTCSTSPCGATICICGFSGLAQHQALVHP